MKAIDKLRKSADSATTRVDSYKGFDDQGHDMGARAVMGQGQPETPRPHKTTQGDVSDDETDRFSKGAGIFSRTKSPSTEFPASQPISNSPGQFGATTAAGASMPGAIGNEAAVRQYLSEWIRRHSDDPGSGEVDWEDAEEDLPWGSNYDPEILGDLHYRLREQAPYGLGDREEAIREVLGMLNFPKSGEDRITAPEIVQPVPVTPSQSVLKAKKIAPASLPTLAKTDGNRMRFGKPYRSPTETFADKRSAMKKTAQGQLTQPQPQSKFRVGPKMTPPGSPTLLPPGSTGAGSKPQDFGAAAAGTPNQPTPGAGPQPQLHRAGEPPPPGSQYVPHPTDEGDWRGPLPGDAGGSPAPQMTGPRKVMESALDLMQNQPTPGAGPRPAAPPPPRGLDPNALPGVSDTPPVPRSVKPSTPYGPQRPSLGAAPPPSPSWGGAWNALKGAWGQLPGMGKGIVGGGGIALLLLLLSKLFGKRGDASYSEGEIERAGNLLDQMSQRQKMALWGEAQARPDEIEKMACNMAKRYSRTHKVGKPPAKKGQFAAGNRFQGVKQAQGPGIPSVHSALRGAPRPSPTAAPSASSAPLPQWAQQMTAPRRPTGMFGPSSALQTRVPAPAASPVETVNNWFSGPTMPLPGQKPMPTVQQMMSQGRRMRSRNFGAEMAGKRDFVANPDPALNQPSSSQQAPTPSQAPNAVQYQQLNNPSQIMQNFMKMFQRLGPASGPPSSPGQFGTAAGTQATPRPKITRLPPEPGPPVQMEMTAPPPPMTRPDKIIGPGPPPPAEPLNLQSPWGASTGTAQKELGRISEQLNQIKVPTPTKPPVPMSGGLSISPQQSIPRPLQAKEGTWVTRNGKRVHIKHKKKRKKSALDLYKASQNIPPAAMAGIMTGIPMGGALRGAPIGGALGALVGHGRGNMSEGIGRGILRGGATGFGAAGGAMAGELLSSKQSPGVQLLMSLLGAGLGGGAGYAGSGKMLGPAQGRRSRAEMEDELQQELNAKSAVRTGDMRAGGAPCDEERYLVGPHKRLQPPGRGLGRKFKEQQAEKESAADFGAKSAGDMPAFTSQARPAKVKGIYSALKRDHPEMPAEMKARIAARQGKPGRQSQGPPYKGPLTKAAWAADLAT